MYIYRLYIYMYNVPIPVGQMVGHTRRNLCPHEERATIYILITASHTHTHTHASSAGCASSLPPPMYNLWLNKNPIFLPLSPFVSSTSPQPPTIRRRADPALARPLPPPVPAHPCPNDVGRRALHRASLFGQLHTRQRTGRLFANGR